MATRVIRVTPTSYADTTNAVNEVVFNPTEIPGAVSANGKSAKIKSISLIDYNDNINDTVLLYFFQKGDNDLGTLGAVVDITDAEILANKFLGFVTLTPPTTAGNAGDLIVAVSATNEGLNLGVKAEYGSSSIYVAAIAPSSGFVSTAAGLELAITFED
jgi:hypothetical protein